MSFFIEEKKPCVKFLYSLNILVSFLHGAQTATYIMGTGVKVAGA